MRNAGGCGAMALQRITEECFISPSQEQLLNSLPDWEGGRAKDAAADFTPEELRPARAEAPTTRSVSTSSPECARVHYGDLESQDGVEWGSPKDSFNGAFESDRSKSPRRRLYGISRGDLAEPSAAASCADGGVLKSPQDDRSDACSSPAPGRGGPARSSLMDQDRAQEDTVDWLERKTEDETGGNLQSLHGITEDRGVAEQSEVFRRARVSTGDSDEANQGGASHSNKQNKKQKVSHIVKHEQTGGSPPCSHGTVENSAAAQQSVIARPARVFLGDSAECVQGGPGHGSRQEKTQKVPYTVKQEQTGVSPQSLHGTAEASGAAQQSKVARPARISRGDPAETAVQAQASLVRKLRMSTNYHVSEDDDGKGSERASSIVERVEGHAPSERREAGAEHCPIRRLGNGPRGVVACPVVRPSKVSPDQVKLLSYKTLPSCEEKEVKGRGTGAQASKQSGQDEVGQGSKGEAVASRTESSFSFGARDEVQNLDSPDLFGKQDDLMQPTKEFARPVSIAGTSSLADGAAGAPAITLVCEELCRDAARRSADGDQVPVRIETVDRPEQRHRFFPKSVMEVVRYCSGDLPARSGTSANASSDLLAAAVQSGVTLPLPFQRKYPFSL